MLPQMLIAVDFVLLAIMFGVAGLFEGEKQAAQRA